MGTVSVSSPAPHVVQVTLDRPDALNTINRELVGDLTAVLDDIDADFACRVVVLTGAGPGFCAGLDLNGYALTSSSSRKVPCRHS